MTIERIAQRLRQDQKELAQAEPRIPEHRRPRLEHQRERIDRVLEALREEDREPAQA